MSIDTTADEKNYDWPKEDGLTLAWIVMSRSEYGSSIYEKAEKYWLKYAHEAVVSDRPLNVTIVIV